MTESIYGGGSDQGVIHTHFYYLTKRGITNTYEQYVRSYPGPKPVEQDLTDIGEQIRDVVMSMLDEATADEIHGIWQIDQEVCPRDGLRRNRSDLRRVKGCRRTYVRPRTRVERSELLRDPSVREARFQINQTMTETTRHNGEQMYSPYREPSATEVS